METLLDDIRDNRSINLLKQFKASIFECAKEIGSNDQTFGISTFSEVGDVFSDLTIKYVDSVQLLEAAQRTFTHLYEEVDKDEQDPNGGEPVDLTAFKQVFDQKLETELTAHVTDEAEAQVAIHSLVRPQPEVPAPTPDEECIVEQNVNREIPKDPITKRTIKIAVKSKRCGHIYDQESISCYIAQKEKNKMKAQCPLAACTNKNMKASELIFDEETNALIASLV